MASEPKITIVGVGPVGGILAAHLAFAGRYTVLCDVRKPHLDVILTRKPMKDMMDFEQTELPAEELMREAILLLRRSSKVWRWSRRHRRASNG